MIVGTTAQRPMELPVRLLDGQVIDAGVATAHEPVSFEFPVLVAVRPKPVPCIVMPLVGIPNGDAIALERPQLLDESVVELLVPLALKKGLGLGPVVDELGAVAPLGIQGVCRCNPGGVARVPAVFSQTDLLNGRFACERGQWGTSFHGKTFNRHVEQLVYMGDVSQCRTICLQCDHEI